MRFATVDTERVPEMSNSQSNQPDPLERHKSEHRALAVLRMLERQPSYASNGEIVCSYFDLVGLGCTCSQAHECLDMLERSGLIEMSKVDRLTVIRLTAKGEEAGKGLLVVEGVLRPGVDCRY